MSISGNQKDREHSNFQEHPSKPSNTERFVADETAHGKLDTIAGALGSGSTVATFYNLSIPSSNTEVSQALPTNTKKFIFKSRSKGTIKLSHTSTESGTKYITIPPGSVYEDINLYTSLTIYIQSSKAGDTLEIIAYV